MGLAPLVELQQLDLQGTEVPEWEKPTTQSGVLHCATPPKKARQMQQCTKEWRIIRRSGTQIL
eukprot:3818148-Amphidinium_carterae.1